MDLSQDARTTIIVVSGKKEKNYSYYSIPIDNIYCNITSYPTFSMDCSFFSCSFFFLACFDVQPANRGTATAARVVAVVYPTVILDSATTIQTAAWTRASNQHPGFVLTLVLLTTFIKSSFMHHLFCRCQNFSSTLATRAVRRLRRAI